jgi:hypothetical protein
MDLAREVAGGMAISTKKRWSQRVTENSDALTLQEGVFSRDDPRSIARSLKRSADRSRRRKSDPYRSAASMLTFYINRAGKTLSATRRRKLEAAKNELRRLYGRDPVQPMRGGREPASGRRPASQRRKAAKKRSPKRRTLARRKTGSRRTHHGAK